MSPCCPQQGRTIQDCVDREPSLNARIDDLVDRTIEQITDAIQAIQPCTEGECEIRDAWETSRSPELVPTHERPVVNARMKRLYRAAADGCMGDLANAIYEMNAEDLARFRAGEIPIHLAKKNRLQSFLRLEEDRKHNRLMEKLLYTAPRNILLSIIKKTLDFEMHDVPGIELEQFRVEETPRTCLVTIQFRGRKGKFLNGLELKALRTYIVRLIDIMRQDQSLDLVGWESVLRYLDAHVTSPEGMELDDLVRREQSFAWVAHKVKGNGNFADHKWGSGFREGIPPVYSMMLSGLEFLEIEPSMGMFPIFRVSGAKEFLITNDILTWLADPPPDLEMPNFVPRDVAKFEKYNISDDTSVLLRDEFQKNKTSILRQTIWTANYHKTYMVSLANELVCKLNRDDKSATGEVIDSARATIRLIYSMEARMMRLLNTFSYAMGCIDGSAAENRYILDRKEELYSYIDRLAEVRSWFKTMAVKFRQGLGLPKRKRPKKPKARQSRRSRREECHKCFAAIVLDIQAPPDGWSEMVARLLPPGPCGRERQKSERLKASLSKKMKTEKTENASNVKSSSLYKRAEWRRYTGCQTISAARPWILLLGHLKLYCLGKSRPRLAHMERGRGPVGIGMMQNILAQRPVFETPLGQYQQHIVKRADVAIQTVKGQAASPFMLRPRGD
ncbi:hypothetical protein JHW43_008825 [Diplocarpon mali]|nr:hypothetical protein JHW43_008825 [Diplocarpon mali]